MIALPSVWHPVAGQGAQPAHGETPSAGSEELEQILHTACEPVWLRMYPDELARIEKQLLCARGEICGGTSLMTGIAMSP